MEELFNKLNSKFTAYNWNKHSPKSNNETTEKIKDEIMAILKGCQLEPPVSQENGGRECPLCGGKNKKEFGGNDKCFHCENKTCGFVQCEQSADDVIYMVSKRIKKFYKG